MSLLILTIGTGTAGKHSDLASGLAKTMTLLAPRKVFLVPSKNETSLAIADLLAQEMPPPANDTLPLDEPDDLESCRRHLREVIAKAKAQLQKGETLLVNPTSGTKQMTAAATLAALDEQIGGIVFTTGERADGVVKTGTEKITAFDASAYFRERDFALAREFFDTGNFAAAGRILSPHKTIFPREYGAARTCHHWRRFDYERAKAYKAGLASRLNGTAAAGKLIIADHLAWADFAIRHHDADSAIRLTYKALELAARLFFEEETGLRPDAVGRYPARAILDLKTSFIPNQDRPETALGLQAMVKILKDLRHPFGEKFDHPLFELSGIRNDATHGIRPAEKHEAQSYLDRAKNLTAIAPTKLPTSF
jgi:hypothetical protein